MTTKSGLTKSIAVLFLGITASAYSHAWTKSLTFESGSIGTKAEDQPDAFDDAAGYSLYTNQESVQGSKAARLYIEEGQKGYGTWGGVVAFPEDLRKGDELWFSVNTYFPEGFNYDSSGEGNHLKFLRVHVSDTTGSNVGYNDWYIPPESSSTAHKFIFEGAPQWFTFGSPSDKVERGVWEAYEMYIKFDNVPVSEGGNARVRVWKNGKLLRDITSVKTLKNATDTADRAHLFTYWNGGAPKSQKMYVDNIVLTTETPSYVDQQGNRMATAPIMPRPLPPEVTAN